MKLLEIFGEINKGDASIAGGKGASLGEMTQAGIPVPPGFVILAGTFERFIEETDLNVEIDSILHGVKHQEIYTVENASEKIQALILNAQMPKDIEQEIEKYFTELNTQYVAVRSSATAEDGAENAWAGQLDSFLNTTKKDLFDKVKRCWASLFTPRAIFYRFEKGLHDTKISVAVVVQKMVVSEVSGIAFSVHPVTEDHNQMIIEAGFGLGEAIVSGSVTPDSYVVEKEPRNILDINVSTQNRGLYCSDTASVDHGNNEWRDIPEPKASSQVLTKDQILELSEIIIGIENHYGFPCDIEWAFEAEKFYIVQSRPITTLSKSGTKDNTNSFEKWIIQNRLDFLYKANYDLFTIDLYYQTSLQNKTFIGSQDLDYIIVSERGEAAAYYPVKQEDKAKLFDEQILREVISRSEIAKNKYQEFCNKFDSKIEDTNLSTFFLEFCSLYIELVACFRTTRPVYMDSLVEDLKTKLSLQEVDPETVGTLIISETDDDIRLEQSDWVDLIKMDNITADEFESHAKKYPWLFPSEYDKDKAIKKLRDRYSADIKKKSEKIKEFEITQKGLKDNIELKKRSLSKYTDGNIKDLAETIVLLSEFRTFFKLALGGITFKFKENFIKIASIANLNVNKFYNSYTINDIKELLQSGNILPKSIADQRNEFYIYVVKNLENEISSDSELSTIIKKHFSSDKKSYIAGSSACPGIVTGEARVLSNSEIKDLQEDSLAGKILVTTMTDPSIMPFIRNCIAFVTDEGGLTSHAAIVSRELDIPCIVGTKIGTQTIPNGSTIEVDANSGIVRIINNN